LSDELAAVVLKEISAAVRERFRLIVAELNAHGHHMSDYGAQSDVELDVRDLLGSTNCALRLAVDLVVSTGYKDIH
jgi:hypothetical protein